MKTQSAFIIAFLTIVCITAGAQQIDTTVAMVKLIKTEQISLRSLNAEIAKYTKIWASQGKILSEQDKTAILWRMIDAILFKQAAQRDNVQVTDAQAAAAIAQVKQSLSSQLGREATDADVRSQVAQEGLTWEAWIASVKDQLLPQVYSTRARYADIQGVPIPSESDIEYYYQTNVQEFTLATIVEFKHIFADTTGKTDAQTAAAKARLDALVSRIRAGESFESLVKENSDDSETRDRDGYSGFLKLDSAQAKVLGRDFIQGLINLKEGQVSDVLRSPAGFHIVKAIRLIPAKLYGLNDKVPPTYQQSPADVIKGLLYSTAQQNAANMAIDKTKIDLRKAAEIIFTNVDIGFKRTE